MKKKEMKKEDNRTIIYELLDKYAELILKYNVSNRGTKGLEKECKDLASELVERNLLTENQVEKLFR